MWDLVTWQGTEPGPPALGAQSLSHWTTREIPKCRYLKKSRQLDGMMVIHPWFREQPIFSGWRAQETTNPFLGITCRALSFSCYFWVSVTMTTNSLAWNMWNVFFFNVEPRSPKSGCRRVALPPKALGQTLLRFFQLLVVPVSSLLAASHQSLLTWPPFVHLYLLLFCLK